ncbi:putative Glycogen recognition site of AMP-activated protein kinase [Blattamonas nauphoetae]|uniref:Glycogen recognition site of AMP-activated protein kinase n=1 Tax=Blattamonas nauphoetae TaxID=2049346 RepID=A0ABQ9X227_9EUKA|nr:putative Glycogen recognition site of AMP-activated protein kinase [Blattamonas nauphoetae]
MESRTEHGITMVGSSPTPDSQPDSKSEQFDVSSFSTSVPEIDLVPVEFTWTLPSGEDIVYLSGTFNQWSERVPLQVRRPRTSPFARCSEQKSSPTWHTTLHLAPGLHAIRFIVEGKWRVNNDLPIHKDSHGNEFNAVYISQVEESSKNSNPWTDEPFHCSGRPQSLAEALTFSHLNFDRALQTEQFLLPFPPSSCDEHLYLYQGKNSNLVSTAITIRIRDKFITSQLYQYSHTYNPQQDQTIEE